ncbi:uncharacterized protein B0H18DRAFT_666389 [Fomitopsis serialis]|uniref:uncharacterized protein n=1 Tax=Fomitopsis serialis TaxID=139415 RepID=UPI0020083FD9|nr:uncharacterized protein B0H18DRAFT_666389 [Neoantrodia serialis]KAH9918480.1 hypothetical protein B0H18DRAFT_666389 [Neoantrodia serialis]
MRQGCAGIVCRSIPLGPGTAASWSQYVAMGMATAEANCREVGVITEPQLWDQKGRTGARPGSKWPVSDVVAEVKERSESGPSLVLDAAGLAWNPGNRLRRAEAADGRPGPAGGRSGDSQSVSAGVSQRPDRLPFRGCDAVGTAAELLYVLSSSLRWNLTFAFSWTRSVEPCKRHKDDGQICVVDPRHTRRRTYTARLDVSPSQVSPASCNTSGPLSSSCSLDTGLPIDINTPLEVELVSAILYNPRHSITPCST